MCMSLPPPPPPHFFLATALTRIKAVAREKWGGGGGGGGANSCTSDDHACKELAIVSLYIYYCCKCLQLLIHIVVTNQVLHGNTKVKGPVIKASDVVDEL